jgi:hypothetical protein
VLDEITLHITSCARPIPNPARPAHSGLLILSGSASIIGGAAPGGNGVLGLSPEPLLPPPLVKLVGLVVVETTGVLITELPKPSSAQAGIGISCCVGDSCFATSVGC